jgi:hypothetical protein
VDLQVPWLWRQLARWTVVETDTVCDEEAGYVYVAAAAVVLADICF